MMISPLCPKCGGVFDEGSASASSGALVYLSNQQPASAKTTVIRAARVCLNCGYVEFYVRVEELKKRLSSAG